MGEDFGQLGHEFKSFSYGSVPIRLSCLGWSYSNWTVISLALLGFVQNENNYGDLQYWKDNYLEACPVISVLVWTQFRKGLQVRNCFPQRQDKFLTANSKIFLLHLTWFLKRQGSFLLLFFLLPFWPLLSFLYRLFAPSLIPYCALLGLLSLVLISSVHSPMVKFLGDLSWTY